MRPARKYHLIRHSGSCQPGLNVSPRFTGNYISIKSRIIVENTAAAIRDLSAARQLSEDRDLLKTIIEETLQ